MAGSRSIFKESWVMLIVYATAIILIFTLTFHLLLQSPLTGLSFQETLSFAYVSRNLLYYRVIFGLLLYAATIHGMIGLRTVILEWLHPKSYTWAINLMTVVVMAAVLALGTLTLILL